MTGQGSSLRSQPCPTKGPTARAVAGGVQAVAGAVHHDYIPQRPILGYAHGVRLRACLSFCKAALSASGRCPFIRWELSSRNIKAALSADERAAFEMWKHCRWRAKDELRSRHGLPMGLLTLYLAYSMMNFTMRSCEAPPLPVWPLVSVTFVALALLMV